MIVNREARALVNAAEDIAEKYEEALEEIEQLKETHDELVIENKVLKQKITDLEAVIEKTEEVIRQIQDDHSDRREDGLCNAGTESPQ